MQGQKACEPPLSSTPHMEEGSLFKNWTLQDLILCLPSPPLFLTLVISLHWVQASSFGNDTSSFHTEIMSGKAGNMHESPCIDGIHWRKYSEGRLQLMASGFLGEVPLLIYMTIGCFMMHVLMWLQHALTAMPPTGLLTYKGICVGNLSLPLAEAEEDCFWLTYSSNMHQIHSVIYITY